MTLLATTFPKSGTHLLRQILGPHRWLPQLQEVNVFTLLKDSGVVVPERKRRAVSRAASMAYMLEVISGIAATDCRTMIGHLPYRPEFPPLFSEVGIRTVLLIRDPRDAVLAHWHSFTRTDRPQRPFDFLFADGKRISEKRDPLAECIRLAPDWWAGWTPWVRDNPVDLVLRYEDLIGPEREEAIKRLAGLMGPSFSVADAVARIDPQRSRTFRRGLAGAWRQEFKARHIRLFTEVMGPTMKLLGYD